VRGSPLLRALLVLGVILALGWPLHRLTEHTAEVSVAQSGGPAQPAKAAKAAALPVVLTFSRAAARVEVRHLGKVLWSKEKPGLKETAEWSLAFPKEGVEFGVQVDWAGDEVPAALRVQLTTPDGEELDRTVWGGGMFEAVIPFP